MANQTITQQFESLNLIVKLVLIFLLGWIICPIFRILKYTESKNLTTLVVGILGLVTGIGNVILEIADFVTELLSGKITLFAD